MTPRGLFVTLKKGDQVRGLQGEIEPTRPLYQQVIVFTRRAATRDPRFLPLTERDLGSLNGSERIAPAVARDRLRDGVGGGRAHVAAAARLDADQPRPRLFPERHGV